jgi:hypothetical protein
MKPNKLKWAISQTPEPFPSLTPLADEDEANYGDFNAALSDPREGNVAVASDRRLCEHRRDLEDLEDAERRLADPTDKVKPFKPSF